jgi:hypothetical protein
MNLTKVIKYLVAEAGQSLRYALDSSARTLRLCLILAMSGLITSGSQDSHLAWLCRQDPGSGAAETAPLIETWVQRYSPPVDTRQQLVSADVANFRSALGELTVAAALDDLGFTVNMKPQFPRPELTNKAIPAALSFRSSMDAWLSL